MVGQIAIGIAFASALIGSILYYLVAKGRTEYLSAARISAHLCIWAVIISAGTLLYYIFNYRFDISYVYEHVSRSLSKPLLFSTFYASQEGSFMLWALLTAIIAIPLMPYASRQRYEAPVMTVYLSILAFLAIMLVVKTPFASIYAAHPGEVPAGFIPPDGKGLNPSLENLWIAIHPPMLFTGFSLLAVPFAFAIAGLWRRDYQGWITTSLPWTLGAAMILGFGIILGGFWAYETLGWGGYWAWDPVENASLLPWLITVAAFHTMLTQKKTGGLVRTNLLMTLLAYALVIYCSFMTRSGVLADASVHSFVAPGGEVRLLLTLALIIFVGGPLVFFAIRMRDMKTRAAEYKLLSRETALSIGAAIVGASALVIFVGTSAPLVSKKVDISYYADLHVPIAIVLMLVNALSLILKWKQSNTREMVKKGAWALITSFVITGALYAFGIRDIGYSLIIAAALFSLLVNLEVTYSLLKGKLGFVVNRDADVRTKLLGAFRWMVILGILTMIIAAKGDFYKFGYYVVDYGLYWLAATLLVVFSFVVFGAVKLKADSRFIGAYVAHMGLALFIIGVVASSHYEETTEFTIMEKEKVKLFNDYELNYGGYKLTPPQSYSFVINVHDKDGGIESVEPILFFSAFDNFKTANPKPSILKYGSRDLYFTVKGTEPVGGPPKDSLTKGQTIPIIGGAVDVTFNEFEFTAEERQKMMSGQTFTVLAKLSAKVKGSSEVIPFETSVTRNLETQEASKDDVLIPGTPYYVALAELRPNLEDRDKSKIIITSFDSTNPPPPIKERVFVQAFVKPYINMVWAGVIILTIGFGFSMIRRRKEALAAISKAEQMFEKIKGHHAPSDDSAAPIANKPEMPFPTTIKKTA